MRICILIVAISFSVSPGLAGPISTTRVASGLDLPVYGTAPPGDTNRLFIVEQLSGDIKILDLNTGVVNPTSFLSIPDVRQDYFGGVAGMAFHPNYATNGYFYVNVMPATGGIRNEIRRYQVSNTNPDIAQEAPWSGPFGPSPIVISYAQPGSDHSGSWIGFGPDGYLYHASGDGGGHDDPLNRAQNLSDLHGKLLRIDVGLDGEADDFPSSEFKNYAIPPSNPYVGGPELDEIWAYGLRSPWRASFDRQTGDLYIGDVGWNNREEVDFQPAGSNGGENYAWPIREGTVATPGGEDAGPKPAGAIDPIYDYQHMPAGAPLAQSITGGYVYRGPGTAIDGQYFFADYEQGNIWSLRFDGSAVEELDGTNYTQLTEWTTEFGSSIGGFSIDHPSSFAEDGVGNLYILDHLDGEIYKIEVPIPADFNGDGQVDPADFAILAENWLNPGSSSVGDANGDGFVDPADFAILAGNWLYGVGQVSGVPEPTTLLLCVLGAVGMPFFYVKRKSPQNRS